MVEILDCSTDYTETMICENCKNVVFGEWRRATCKYGCDVTVDCHCSLWDEKEKGRNLLK